MRIRDEEKMNAMLDPGKVVLDMTIDAVKMYLQHNGDEEPTDIAITPGIETLLQTHLTRRKSYRDLPDLREDHPRLWGMLVHWDAQDFCLYGPSHPVPEGGVLRRKAD